MNIFNIIYYKYIKLYLQQITYIDNTKYITNIIKESL